MQEQKTRKLNVPSHKLLLVGLSFALGGCTGDLNAESALEEGPLEFEVGQGSPTEPAGAMPPTVGQEFTCDEAAARPGENLVRRLTPREYARTVLDTLGVDVTLEAVST